MIGHFETYYPRVFGQANYFQITVCLEIMLVMLVETPYQKVCGQAGSCIVRKHAHNIYRILLKESALANKRAPPPQLFRPIGRKSANT